MNGGLRNGSLSPEFDDIDNSTLPIHLVYARPPSTADDRRQAQQFTYSTTRKERYHSTDGVTLNQVHTYERPYRPLEAASNNNNNNLAGGSPTFLARPES